MRMAKRIHFSGQGRRAGGGGGGLGEGAGADMVWNEYCFVTQ
jgi:hypothetical protein